MSEAREAVQAVRLAAHELIVACAEVVGGVPMALSLRDIDVVGESAEPLWPTRPVSPQSPQLKP